MIQGDAAVDLGLDGIGDLLVVLADDPHLHPALSHGGGLIGDHRIQDDEDDAVQGLFQFGIRDLEKEDHDIKAVHGHRQGDPQLLFKKEHGNVISSGGGACPDHQADARSDQKTA